MYTEFFQPNALPLDQLKGVYDSRLVILSYLVAVMASYVALDLTGRLRDHNNTKKDTWLWLIGGAIAMGSGIWSMHFIGMLSFSIPGITLEYNLYWTILSLCVAVFASGFALFLLKKSIINIIHLIAGGFILGLSIASMHYTGMTALLISLNISYLPSLFLLSILVAIIASEAAIWFALKSNTVVAALRNRIKTLSAMIMGFAIFGMHYTGMAASVFSPLCTPSISTDEISGISPAALSIIIAAATFIIMGVAFLASNYKEAKNQQQFEKARELGMAEMSASVLHNVGNVINSINISIETLLANRNSSPLKALEKLATLFNTHKDDLPQFLSQDTRGAHIPAYINELALCWEKEHTHDVAELEEMTKNITLIKSIINTQQTAVKKEPFEQIISLNELIDESLLLSGTYLNKEIRVIKEYGDIKPIVIDQTKLFQILNNIISNGKDALAESANTPKILTIKTELITKDKIKIQISDNGVGISNSNLSQIFIFGFTTKKSGHGFGLHASAVAVNELGGEIQVSSEGEEQGSTFTIYLPNSKATILKNM
ncbi:MHYT domain-containing protein [Legionella rowbothamii]|uniref:MHYT domain-containing protein n=1 Tax=Legionella rowbothamii TaxID=96229 RepID=UPI0010562603|nr:MHYT domain-containing protein [Legionella rowbothamii]